MQPNRHERRALAAADRKGWRPRPWGEEVGIGHSKVHELIASKEIHSVKIGHARVITTPPAVYLARLAAEQAA
jgi:hypothetical protein